MSILDRVFGDDQRTFTGQLKIDADDIFHLLSSTRRRHILAIVSDLDPGETITVRELSRHIAFIENDYGRVEEVTGSDRKTVYVSLWQSHLEKMADHGAIEFDAGRSTVGASSITDDLSSAMRDVEQLLAEAGRTGYVPMGVDA